MRRLTCAMIALLATTCVSPVMAQSVPTAVPDAAEALSREVIVVTAPRIKGSVDTDLPLEMVLDEQGIASYGASNVADLLSALGNQTQSTRSRGSGGGMPIVLLNGRRISGFQEMRELPMEAIVRVEILPEDVALRYGYAAGQRVVNFILKDNFSIRSAEVEYGGPTAGGHPRIQLEAGYLKIGKKGRVSLNGEVQRYAALTEQQRHLLPTGADPSGLRTLLPRNDSVNLNGTFSRSLNEMVIATLNAKYDVSDNKSVLGLPLSLIANPAALPFDVLDRDNKAYTLHVGASLDKGQGLWRWTLTGSYDRALNIILTDRNSANAALLGALPLDSSRSLLTTANITGTVDGRLMRLPAGDVKLSLKAGYEDQGFDSYANNALGITTGKLARRDLEGRVSLDVPILTRSEGLGQKFGRFGINGNFARSDLSDFGSLNSYGFGFNWSPLEGLSIFGSMTVAQAAPSPQQLGDPRLLTSNVSIYDYSRATTVLASLISGGNASLKAEEQRDRSITVSLSPPSLKNFTISGTYTAKRSENLLAGFPSLNFETERAFASRIVRDGAGNLVSIDQRPVNFLASSDDTLRWGMQFSREFGRPAGRGGPGGGGFGGPRPQGGRPPMGGFGGPGGGGGRWTLSLYHTLKLKDQIAIAPGLPLLDRLNGSATGFTGGTPRHKIDLEGGWFHNGKGVRGNASWRSGSRVTGGLGSPDLFYSGLATVNLRLFLNFDQQKKILKSVPFLKGSRLTFKIDNLFDSIQSVRDASGATPLRYQPAYLDPLGRVLEISFRKTF